MADGDFFLGGGQASGIRWPDRRRGPWYVVAHWADVDGVPEAVGLELWKSVEPTADRQRFQAIRGAPQEGIGGKDLRTIPVGQVLAALWDQEVEDQSRATAGLAKASDDAVDEGEPDAADLLAEVARISSEGTFRGPTPKRRRSNDVGHFTEVATIYKTALQHRRPPTAEVAEQLHVSYSTATKWARKARDLGLLPPTQPGRPSHVTNRRTSKGKS